MGLGSCSCRNWPRKYNRVSEHVYRSRNEKSAKSEQVLHLVHKVLVGVVGGFGGGCGGGCFGALRLCACVSRSNQIKCSSENRTKLTLDAEGDLAGLQRRRLVASGARDDGAGQAALHAHLDAGGHEARRLQLQVLQLRLGLDHRRRLRRLAAGGPFTSFYHCNRLQ